MAFDFKPIGDKIVIEAAPAETMTASGLYIPETAQEKPQTGTVIAVGPGKYAELTGNLIPISVKVGDVVFYGKYSHGQELSINGKDYLILKESDLLGLK